MSNMTRKRRRDREENIKKKRKIMRGEETTGIMHRGENMKKNGNIIVTEEGKQKSCKEKKI